MLRIQEALEPTQRLELATSEDLVALVNQSLGDTLDLAYQTRQAQWHAHGMNFYGLHLLLSMIHTQLTGYVDAFAMRAMALGGQAHTTIRAAGAASYLAEYPQSIRRTHVHVETLVDRYGEYTRRLRNGIQEAIRMGDLETSALYIEVSRAMDAAFWKLRSHHES